MPSCYSKVGLFEDIILNEWHKTCQSLFCISELTLLLSQVTFRILVAYEVAYLNMSYFNVTGTYAFLDLVFNETSGNTERLYGNVTVNPDYHLRAGFQDNIVNDEEDNDTEERPAFLLFIAAGSGIGAAILGGMIIFGNKEED